MLTGWPCQHSNSVTAKLTSEPRPARVTVVAKSCTCLTPALRPFLCLCPLLSSVSEIIGPLHHAALTFSYCATYANPHRLPISLAQAFVVDGGAKREKGKTIHARIKPWTYTRPTRRF